MPDIYSIFIASLAVREGQRDRLQFSAFAAVFRFDGQFDRPIVTASVLNFRNGLSEFAYRYALTVARWLDIGFPCAKIVSMIKVTITIGGDNQGGTGGRIGVETDPVNPPSLERKMLEDFLTEKGLAVVETVISEKLKGMNRNAQ